MKHPSNQQFFAYWDAKRGGARAPDRSEIEPDAVRELLGDIFVLSCESSAGYPFRVAGTRLCALLGRDLKDKSFSELFIESGRREIEDIITVVTEEMLAAVAGITAISEDGSQAHLELLLLPFSHRAHAPMSLTGLQAPFESGRGRLKDFRLTSWRYIGHQPPERLVPRALRKLKIARGLMVYEGLRQRAPFSDGVAAVHANNSTADELREIEAFYRLPVGRARLIEALRQKGHTL